MTARQPASRVLRININPYASAVPHRVAAFPPPTTFSTRSDNDRPGGLPPFHQPLAGQLGPSVHSPHDNGDGGGNYSPLIFKFNHSEGRRGKDRLRKLKVPPVVGEHTWFEHGQGRPQTFFQEGATLINCQVQGATICCLFRHIL